MRVQVSFPFTCGLSRRSCLWPKCIHQGEAQLHQALGDIVPTVATIQEQNNPKWKSCLTEDNVYNIIHTPVGMFRQSSFTVRIQLKTLISCWHQQMEKTVTFDDLKRVTMSVLTNLDWQHKWQTSPRQNQSMPLWGRWYTSNIVLCKSKNWFLLSESKNAICHFKSMKATLRPAGVST